MRLFTDARFHRYQSLGLSARPAGTSQIRTAEAVAGGGELRAVASRKLQPPLPAAEITTLLEAMSGFEVVNTDANLVLDAHLLAERERLSWFDALIAEAAIRSRCVVLFSEDFSHGRRIADLEVVNPLRG